jgi:hypothetical protein
VQLKGYRAEVVHVLQELGEDTSRAPVVRDLDLAENPERKLEYTADTLLKFKAEMERRALDKAARGNQGGGFGGFGGGNKAEADDSQPYVLCLRLIMS